MEVDLLHEPRNDFLIRCPVLTHYATSEDANNRHIAPFPQVPKGVFASLNPQYIHVSTPITVPASALSNSLTSGLYTLADVPTNTYISQYVFDMGEGTYWVQIGWILLTFVVIRIGVVLSFQFISHIKR
jgi:hypothetical protein